MAGQYPWQGPGERQSLYGQSSPSTTSWPMGEPPRPGDDKPNGESKGKSLREWISTTSVAANVIVAVVALIVGGSAAATVHVVMSPPKPSPTIAQVSPSASSVHPSFSIPVSRDPISASSPTTVKPGTEVKSWTVYIPNAQGITYPTADGGAVMFYYYGYYNRLDAGKGVDLAVIHGPGPTANSAYQACESASDLTQQVQLGSLAANDSVCAFTPNNQVTWIQFLGVDSEGYNSEPLLHVSAITWQTPNG